MACRQPVSGFRLIDEPTIERADASGEETAVMPTDGAEYQAS